MTDWNKEAKEMADYVQSELFPAHRGATEFHRPPFAVVFGNDDYSRVKEAQKEVELVRQYLPNLEAEEMGFALTNNGYSWAMIVRGATVDELEYLVCFARYVATGVEPEEAHQWLQESGGMSELPGSQAYEAARALEEKKIRPDGSLN